MKKKETSPLKKVLFCCEFSSAPFGVIPTQIVATFARNSLLYTDDVPIYFGFCGVRKASHQYSEGYSKRGGKDIAGD